MNSVWIDFTKGLGAPIGAVLAGTAEFIARARRYKQLFGGAMRQAGIAAAGCLYALDHHVDRLANDHENARRLARGLAEIDGIEVRTATPDTNMVFFEASGLGLSNREFLDRLAAAGRSHERRRRGCQGRHPPRRQPRRHRPRARSGARRRRGPRVSRSRHGPHHSASGRANT